MEIKIGCVIKYYFQKLAGIFLSRPIILTGKTVGYSLVKTQISKCRISPKSKIYPPCKIHEIELGPFSYLGKDAVVSYCSIGKYCSIGPNFQCGLGIHPTNGISTSPMFYSSNRQNGFSLCASSKIIENKKTTIGNDVWVGANVTVMDGITIGDGAIVGAGAVVTKDIPPYAIVVGVPAKVIRYRFDEKTIGKLLKIKWWDHEELHPLIESMFFDVNSFINKVGE